MEIIFLTPAVIITGTIAGCVFGAIWYTVLFGKAYMYGLGVTKETLPKRSKKYMMTTNVYSLLAHGGIASTLAVMFDLLQVAELSTAIYMGLFLTFGFIVTTKFVDLTYTVHGAHYEKRPQVNFLVGAGYYICTVMVMSVAMVLAAQG